MKKIILCAALMVAVSLIGIVSIMAQQKKFTPMEKHPKKIERVPSPQVFEPPSVRFGEPNDTAGNAYLLRAGTYHAALSHDADVDYYKFKAPSSNFGSWFKIQFQAKNPRSFSLDVELLGPAGSTLEGKKGPAGSLWIALEKGVEAKIKVIGEAWGDVNAAVFYDITLSSAAIPDNLEDDDSQTKATLITYGGSKTAYMCGVLNSAEETVGLEDWFKYNHRECRNDCVTVSRSAYLELCRSPVLHDCEGCQTGENEGATRICVADGCSGDNWASGGDRYINVRICDWSYSCSGQGDVPSHYRSPYTIRLSDNGFASFDDECGPGD